MTRLLMYRATPSDGGHDVYGYRHADGSAGKQYPSVEMLIEGLVERMAFHRQHSQEISIELGPDRGFAYHFGAGLLWFQSFAHPQLHGLWRELTRA